MRVFLDANILFSAAKSDGAVRALVKLLLERGHECWIDDYVIMEARRNLTSKGPDSLSALDGFVAQMQVGAAQATAGLVEKISWLPEKDRPVLLSAIRLRCQFLVTGDRVHFGAGYGKVFDGVAIHSPRSLAEMVLADE